jgi:hypothetical protein
LRVNMNKVVEFAPKLDENEENPDMLRERFMNNKEKYNKALDDMDFALADKIQEEQNKILKRIREIEGKSI